MRKFAYIAAIIFFFAITFCGTVLFFEKNKRVADRIPPAPVELQSFSGILSALDIQKPPSDNDPNPPSPFGTAPSASSDDSFSFAVIGDTQSFDAGNPNDSFRRVVKEISSAKTDLVLVTGDLTSSCDSYSKCLDKHNKWKEVAAPILSKTYATMGNHDNIKNKGEKAWQDAFDFPTNGPADYSEMVYSFDFKNSHFVVLDSDKNVYHEVDGAQRVWLEQDLAKNKKPNIFIIFHEPAFPVSSKIGESLDKETGPRDDLWKIFDKYKVTAVFNGHEHIVSRRKIDSSVFPGAKNAIYQFVFGSTDSFDHELPGPGVAEFASRGQGRFGIFEVSGNKITAKTMSAGNQELDSFTFSN